MPEPLESSDRDTAGSSEERARTKREVERRMASEARAYAEQDAYDQSVSRPGPTMVTALVRDLFDGMTGVMATWRGAFGRSGVPTRAEVAEDVRSKLAAFDRTDPVRARELEAQVPEGRGFGRFGEHRGEPL